MDELLRPDVLQFLAMLMITLYYLAIFMIREFGLFQNKPEVAPMVPVTNWELVAKLEHDLGYEHTTTQTQEACRHEDCYTPPAPDPWERVAISPNELRVAAGVLSLATVTALADAASKPIKNVSYADNITYEQIEAKPYSGFTARDLSDITPEEAHSRGYTSSEEYLQYLRDVMPLERR